MSYVTVHRAICGCEVQRYARLKTADWPGSGGPGDVELATRIAFCPDHQAVDVLQHEVNRLRLLLLDAEEWLPRSHLQDPREPHAPPCSCELCRIKRHIAWLREHPNVTRNEREE